MDPDTLALGNYYKLVSYASQWLLYTMLRDEERVQDEEVGE